jgi:anti-sigma factor RsiW
LAEPGARRRTEHEILKEQTMAKCTEIDPLVTPYIDGELSPADRAVVHDHLNRCPPCQSRVAAESAVTDLLHARKSQLAAEHAPAALRTRCAKLAGGPPVVASARSHPDSSLPSETPSTGQRTTRRVRLGLPQLALAASLVVAVAGAFLYVGTQYSTRLLAAELCTDHLTCFAANSVSGARHAASTVESSMLSTFGWRVHLPEKFDVSGLELVTGRRCLYGEGRVAHLMYQQQGRPVSIYMLPHTTRSAEVVEVFGHEVAIWPSGDRTFALVTRASRDDVMKLATVVKAALQ